MQSFKEIVSNSILFTKKCYQGAMPQNASTAALWTTGGKSKNCLKRIPNIKDQIMINYLFTCTYTVNTLYNHSIQNLKLKN